MDKFATLNSVAAPHPAREHRHRRDHPDQPPGRQLGARHARAMGLHGPALQAGRIGEPRVRAQPRALPRRADPAGRRQLRLRLLARGRGVGAARRWASAASSARASATSSSTTASRTACCRSCSTGRRWRASPARWRRARAPAASRSISRRWRSRRPRASATRSPWSPRAAQALLEGLDEIAMTLKRAAEIAAFQARDRQQRPWVHEV